MHERISLLLLQALLLLLLLLVCAVFAFKSKKEPLSVLATEDHCHHQQAAIMSEEDSSASAAAPEAADRWLSRAKDLIPSVLDQARAATGFPTRWKSIISKLDRIPPSLSDLSTHPCFAKNALCSDQLRSVCDALTEAATLAQRCSDVDNARRVGKLQMQSDLDALSCKLDLILRDCSLLVKTGVLATATADAADPRPDVSELLARLQIGDAEAKHRAVDDLLQEIKNDEKSVLAALTRTNVSALAQLLTGATAASQKTREKAATVVCLLAEFGSCVEVSEGLLPPLIRLAESGTPMAREKAGISLQRLSMSADTARSIVGNCGVTPLVNICRAGDSVCQAAAAGTLKNLSAVPEIRQALADGEVIQAMISLLGNGIVLGSREYAAECLQNLTAGNDSLRRAVVSDGGVRALLAYLDGPIPQESAVGALRNLVSLVPADGLISLGLLPRLVHVLKHGSLGAQTAAAVAMCKISTSSLEIKKLVGESGCLPLLVRMLEAKAGGAREAAAQTVSILVSWPQNAREVKKDEKSVPNLVQLLDPGSQNTAKKYAVACLVALSSSKRCRKLMVAYGAVGYLKKLSEMEVPGAKKLLERVERGKLRRFFGKKLN